MLSIWTLTGITYITNYKSIVKCLSHVCSMRYTMQGKISFNLLYKWRI